MAERSVPGLPDPPAAGLVGPITLTDIVRYQGASGDFNPLHHDPEVARRAGFDAPVVVGMYVAGLMATWAGEWWGVRQVRRFGIRFQQPVLIGDQLEITGQVCGVDEGPPARSVSITLSCRRRSDGAEVATGWGTYLHERNSDD